MDNTKKNIMDLIANNQLEPALQALEEYANQINKTHLGQIAILKGNLRDIKTKSSLGVLELREEQTQINRIRLAIVQLLDSLDNQGSKNISQLPPRKKNRYKPLLWLFLLFILVVLIWKTCNPSNLSLEDIYKIVDAPPPEKETIILGFGFSEPSEIDNGKSYSRNNHEEIIEDWQLGLVRLITNRKKLYLSIRKEIEQANYEYLKEDDETNNKGDKFFNYRKGSRRIMVGSFATSKQYLIVASDTTKQYTAKYFITGNEIFGKWGRIQNYGQNGNYEFKNDFTFIFVDSECGPITGNWYIEGREIILNYKQARDKRWSSPSSTHALNNKSEVIVLDNKEYSELTGSIKGESDFKSRIILRRIQ